ncbi:14172_t:CDS:2, partial [Funneliformis geosporum]
EELALASDEYHIMSKNKDFRKKDPLSDNTIEGEDSLVGLLHELSTPIKGKTTETNNEDEGSEAIKAEKHVTQAYQEEIPCWYYYAEKFKKNVRDIRNNDSRVTDQ